MTISKKCEICETRPIMSAAAKRAHGVNFPYCEPCMNKADWENTHSDYGHDLDSGEVVDQSGDEEFGHRVSGCWICFPELDTTQAEYVQRKGICRVGQVMHTSLRASGVTKAAEVRAQLPEGTKVLSAGRKPAQDGSVSLKVVGNGLKITIVWDAQGRHFYKRSNAVPTAGGKPRLLRNVSEALRLLTP